jgi:hypothetical protein
MGTGLGLGIGIPFRRMGAGIDSQAQAHYNRVIADGGLIPSGLVGVNNFFKTVKGIYGTSDITTAISVGLDAQILGYKLGAGAGTTAGQAAQKLYSCSGASGDVEQTTAASQPLLLVHSGANYWWGSGASNNYVSTPNAAANQITGDIDIIANIQYVNNGATQFIVSKTQTALTNHGYDFAIQNTNNLYYQQSRAGTFNSTSSSVGIGASYTGWVRMTRVSSTGVVTFFTGTDGINWTQLGTTFTLFTGALNNPTASVNIGSYFNTNNVYQNRLFRVTISNSIGGAPVVDFNPSQYNAANSQTQWVSTSGETWTINVGTASGGYKGAVITRATMQSDGIDDRMTTTASRGNTNTQYTTFSALSADGTGDKIIIDATSANYRNSIAQLNNDIYLWMNNAVSNVSTAKTLRTIGTIITSNNAGVKNSIDLNNGTETTNAYTPTPSGTGISLFSRSDGGAGAFSNSLFTSYVSSKTQDTTTQQSAMFSFLKTFSNY